MMFYRLIKFSPYLATSVVLAISTTLSSSHAQMKTSNLYCCLDDSGKRVCGDGPRYCWGREYDVVNAAGIVVNRVSRPKTAEERRAEAKLEEDKKKEEKKRMEEELRFKHLQSLYGNPESIDKEIERQKNENIENKKIAISRLKTARENVEVFKLQKNGKFSEEDKITLQGYEQTVKDIEEELKNREDQEQRSRERLLADKQRLIDYEADQRKWRESHNK